MSQHTRAVWKEYTDWEEYKCLIDTLYERDFGEDLWPHSETPHECPYNCPYCRNTELYDSVKPDENHNYKFSFSDFLKNKYPDFGFISLKNFIKVKKMDELPGGPRAFNSIHKR